MHSACPYNLETGTRTKTTGLPYCRVFPKKEAEMRTHAALFCGFFFAAASCAFADSLTVIYRDGNRQNVPLAQSSGSIGAIEFTGSTESSGKTVPDLTGIHTLKAKHTGKCLDVAGVGRNNGDNIHQWDCNGGDNQKWRFVPKGGEYFSLVALHSGRCADVAGVGRNNGDNVQQWDCNGGDNQIWRVVSEGGGYYRLTAKHSGRCLDVSGVGTNNGDNVHQWDCHTGDNQKWKIE
jgi:hypothetical protein